MNKSATYDDISEVIKERVDNFELKDNALEERLSIEAINEMLHDLGEFGMAAEHISYDRGICIHPINPMDMRAAMPASIYGCNNKIIVIDEIELAKMEEPTFPANSNPYYPRKYASRDAIELVDAILFQEQKQKQPKDNHPHGWYRKFEKKRY